MASLQTTEQVQRGEAHFLRSQHELESEWTFTLKSVTPKPVAAAIVILCCLLRNHNV